ncbi:MAG: response regulator transcription factor [Chloroflexi bacterium]|nr:response regulator transcription factor [Chloroflexota bacterium]
MVAGGENEPLGRFAYTVGVVGGPAPELQRTLESEDVRAVQVMSGRRDQGNFDALILDLTETHRHDVAKAAQAVPTEGPPVIAAISWDLLRNPEIKISADDVIVVPWRRGELQLRIARLLDRKTPPEASQVIRAGDLVIDPERYDVFVAEKPVFLTFKEYELLKLLAGNPGHVYSREALLEQVWGYHYFGGTRTVDVHVRRLRSKIEDSSHTFIDTVWNVGYRFHG